MLEAHWNSKEKKNYLRYIYFVQYINVRGTLEFKRKKKN